MSVPDARLRDPCSPRPIDQPAVVPLGPDADLAIVWLGDEVVRHWEHERFDADRLVAAFADLGGLDAVVPWHAYPVIGVDPRNQFDWYDVPGLEALVADLQAHGVRVFADYIPWDVGTRRTGRSDAAGLSDLVGRTGVDGVFFDTLKEGDPELLSAMERLRPRPVLEGSPACRWHGSSSTSQRTRSSRAGDGGRPGASRRPRGRPRLRLLARGPAAHRGRVAGRGRFPRLGVETTTAIAVDRERAPRRPDPLGGAEGRLLAPAARRRRTTATRGVSACGAAPRSIPGSCR